MRKASKHGDHGNVQARHHGRARDEAHAPEGSPANHARTDGHARSARPAVHPEPDSHATRVRGTHQVRGPRHVRDAHHLRGAHHVGMIAEFRRRFWISLILSLPVVALDPMVHMHLRLPASPLLENVLWIQWTLASVVYAYGGWPFLTGLVSEARTRRPGMMTLIGIAISVAYGYSAAVVFGLRGSTFLWELATLIDVMLLGHWLEMKSVMGASSAVESLVRLLPAHAHRVRGDTTEDVPLSELRPGDRVIVKPGEKIPMDGEIIQGRSAVDESLLTGESNPAERGPGDSVIGGSVNSDAAFTFEVRRTGADSYLAQVLALVARTQASRSRTQDLANRGARALTIVALTAGAATLAIWLLIGRDLAFALERAVTVMVISCPHALGLAIPLVIAASTAITARRGLLIRDRTAFERARKVNAVLLDKTGTLTEGRFGVTDVIPLAEYAEEEVLTLAAALESQSEHPIGRGIATAAERRGLRPPVARDIRALPGCGLQGSADGHQVKIVSPGHLQSLSLSVDDERVERATRQSKTVVYCLIDDRLVGAIALADVTRAESRAALRDLRAMNVHLMMITGDSRPVAERVARELEMDEVFAEVTPERKAEKVREVQQRGWTVAMAGDGINDAPALIQADVGIAIGAGTEVAIESADVILVRSDPRDVTAVLRLSRKVYRKTVANLMWATGYNIIAIPLAAGVLAPLGVLLSPAVGAALMALSTAIVAFNARSLRG